MRKRIGSRWVRLRELGVIVLMRPQRSAWRIGPGDDEVAMEFGRHGVDICRGCLHSISMVLYRAANGIVIGINLRQRSPSSTSTPIIQLLLKQILPLNESVFENGYKNI